MSVRFLRATISFGVAAFLINFPAHAQSSAEWEGPSFFSNLSTCLEAASAIGDQAREAGDKAWEIVSNSDPTGPWVPSEARQLYDEASRLYELASEAVSACNDAFRELSGRSAGDTLIDGGLLGAKLFDRDRAVTRLATELRDAADLSSNMQRYLLLLEIGDESSSESVLFNFLNEIQFDMLDAKTPQGIADKLRSHLDSLHRDIDTLGSTIASLDIEESKLSSLEGTDVIGTGQSSADLGTVSPPSGWPFSSRDMNRYPSFVDGSALGLDFQVDGGWAFVRRDPAMLEFLMYGTNDRKNYHVAVTEVDGRLVYTVMINADGEDLSGKIRFEHPLLVGLTPASGLVDGSLESTEDAGSFENSGFDAGESTGETLPFSNEPVQGECIEINGEVACR